MDASDPGHDLLSGAVGRRLVGIARAHFRHRGRIDDERGPLELAFDGGPVLHLTTATNGESVWVREGAWRDPIIDPDVDGLAEWIAEHGEWIRGDARERYADAVGQTLDAVRWLANEHGSVAGAELRFGGAMLTFVSWGDDEYVVSGDAAAVPAEWEMRILPSHGTTTQAR